MTVDRFQTFITLVLYALPGLVVGFTLHELMHAVVTDRFGDDTPRRQGRLSLDPLVQIDPVGFALLLAIGFGFARPVQYNALRIRTATRQALVAFAGPATNLVLVLVLAIVLRVLIHIDPGIAIPDGLDFTNYRTPVYFGHGGVAYIVFSIVYQAAFMNALLFVFNMIPIPPLDGFAVLRGAVGNLIPDVIRWMERNAGLLAMGGLAVLFVLPHLGSNPGGNFLSSLVDGVMGRAYGGPPPELSGLDSLFGVLSGR